MALKDDRVEQCLRSCGCEFQMWGPKQEKVIFNTSLTLFGEFRSSYLGKATAMQKQFYSLLSVSEVFSCVQTMVYGFQHSNIIEMTRKPSTFLCRNLNRGSKRAATQSTGEVSSSVCQHRTGSSDREGHIHQGSRRFGRELCVSSFWIPN